MTIELQAELERASKEIVHGWCSPEKAAALAELISETRPRSVVEIGVFGGKSFVPIGMALRSTGRGKAYGIDPWRREDTLEGSQGVESDTWWASIPQHDIHKYAVEQIWKFDLIPWCVLIRTASQYAVGLFSNIDLLHIDGCHSELVSCRDVDLYLPRVKKGGYVFFDDADWLSTQKAMGLIAEQCDLIKQVGTCNLYKKR